MLERYLHILCLNDLFLYFVNDYKISSIGYKRAAVGYGPYDPYRGGVLGNLGGNFGGRFGGRLGGWRNSGLGSFNGRF